MSNNNQLKQSFLLSKSIVIPNDFSAERYDLNQDVNISKTNRGEIPSTLCSNVNTQTKTFAAPSDDDPDTEAELCY